MPQAQRLSHHRILDVLEKKICFLQVRFLNAFYFCLLPDCEDVYGDDSEISDESRNLKIPGTSQVTYAV